MRTWRARVHCGVLVLRITYLLSLHSGTLRVSNSQFVRGITEGKFGRMSSQAYILLILHGTMWLIPFS
jgi:hypothetical protein